MQNDCIWHTCEFSRDYRHIWLIGMLRWQWKRWWMEWAPSCKLTTCLFVKYSRTRQYPIFSRDFQRQSKSSAMKFLETRMWRSWRSNTVEMLEPRRQDILGGKGKSWTDGRDSQKHAPYRCQEDLWKDFEDSFTKDSTQAIFTTAEYLDCMWHISMQSTEFLKHSMLSLSETLGTTYGCKLGLFNIKIGYTVNGCWVLSVVDLVYYRIGNRVIGMVNDFDLTQSQQWTDRNHTIHGNWAPGTKGPGWLCHTQIKKSCLPFLISSTWFRMQNRLLLNSRQHLWKWRLNLIQKLSIICLGTLCEWLICWYWGQGKAGHERYCWV